MCSWVFITDPRPTIHTHARTQSSNSATEIRCMPNSDKQSMLPHSVVYVTWKRYIRWILNIVHNGHTRGSCWLFVFFPIIYDLIRWFDHSKWNKIDYSSKTIWLIEWKIISILNELILRSTHCGHCEWITSSHNCVLFLMIFMVVFAFVWFSRTSFILNCVCLCSAFGISVILSVREDRLKVLTKF